MPSLITGVVCMDCGQPLAPDPLPIVCPHCGSGWLEARYDYAAAAEVWREGLAAIATVHAHGQHLSQAFDRNLVRGWRAGQPRCGAMANCCR